MLKSVTSRINNIMTLAHGLKDYSCVSFLQCYVDEQVEEKDKFNKLVDKVKLVKGSGLYIPDKELFARVFFPIVY